MATDADRDRHELARRHGYVPEPSVLLTGSQPWPPRKDPERPCPVCDKGINPGDTNTSCLWCDAEHPWRAEMMRVARLKADADERCVKARDRSEAATFKLRDDIQRKARREDEDTRERFIRRLWNGYGGSLRHEHPDVTNFIREARRWLTELGLVPDFARKLNRRGSGTDAMDHVEASIVDVDSDATHRHVELRGPLELEAEAVA